MYDHSAINTLPADREASWSLLPSLVTLLSGDIVQQESTHSRIIKIVSS